MKTLILVFLKKYWLYILISLIALAIAIGTIALVVGGDKEEPIKQETISQVEMVTDSTMKVDGITLTPAETKLERKNILERRTNRLANEEKDSRLLFWKNLFKSIMWAIVGAIITYQLVTRVLPWGYAAWLAKKAGPAGATTGATTPPVTPTTPAKAPTTPAAAPVTGTSPWWPLKFAFASIVGIMLLILAVTFTSGDDRLNSLKNGKGFGGFVNIIWDVFTHRISSDDEQTKVVNVTPYPYPDPKALLNVEIGSNNKKDIWVSKEEQEKAIATAVAAELAKRQKEALDAAIQAGTAPTGTITQYAEATMYTVP